MIETTTHAALPQATAILIEADSEIAGVIAQGLGEWLSVTRILDVAELPAAIASDLVIIGPGFSLAAAAVATAEVAERTARVPVISITVENHAEHRARLLLAGATDVIGTPLVRRDVQMIAALALATRAQRDRSAGPIESAVADDEATVDVDAPAGGRDDPQMRGADEGSSRTGDRSAIDPAALDAPHGLDARSEPVSAAERRTARSRSRSSPRRRFVRAAIVACGILAVVVVLAGAATAFTAPAASPAASSHGDESAAPTPVSPSVAPSSVAPTGIAATSAPGAVVSPAPVASMAPARTPNPSRSAVPATASPHATATPAPSGDPIDSLPRDPQVARAVFAPLLPRCADSPPASVGTIVFHTLPSGLLALTMEGHDDVGSMMAGGTIDLAGIDPFEHWHGQLNSTGGSATFEVVTGAGCKQTFAVRIVFVTPAP